MTTAQTFNLFQIVQRLTKDEAEAKAFVNEIAAVVDDKFEQKKDVLATKEDIGIVRSEIKSLEVRMVDQKSEIIRWMFLFWAGSILTTLGGLFAFLKIFLGK